MIDLIEIINQIFELTTLRGKLHMEIIPINFGLKYRPAKLGVEYHIKDQPEAHFVHEIPLSFVTKYSDIDDVTDELLEKYDLYLNPRVVSHNQLRRLVERLVKQLGLIEQSNNNKENKQQMVIDTVKQQLNTV